MVLFFYIANNPDD